jgi:hypothetical protein
MSPRRGRLLSFSPAARQPASPAARQPGSPAARQPGSAALPVRLASPVRPPPRHVSAIALPSRPRSLLTASITLPPAPFPSALHHRPAASPSPSVSRSPRRFRHAPLRPPRALRSPIPSTSVRPLPDSRRLRKALPWPLEMLNPSILGCEKIESCDYHFPGASRSESRRDSVFTSTSNCEENCRFMESKTKYFQ